jgi:hypothetical protein
MPAIVGILSARMQLGAAMGVCACLSYIIVVLAALRLPETRGRDLASVEMQGYGG